MMRSARARKTPWGGAWRAPRGTLSVLLALPVCVAAGREQPTTDPETPSCDPPFSDSPAIGAGHWWEYERTEREEAVPDHVFALTRTILDQRMVLGGCVACRGIGRRRAGQTWLALVDSELRLHEGHPDSTADYAVLLKKPFVVGQRWPYDTPSFGGEALDAEIESVGDTVSVPAGTFAECIHVRVDPCYDTWFRLDIGIIAARETVLDGASGVTDLLVDYDPDTIAR